MTLVNVDIGFCVYVPYSVCVCVCVCLRHHSGVELRRRGLCGTEEAEGSDMAAVVTPIFFRERSSVTEMEREKAGREAAGGPEIDRYIDRQRQRDIFLIVLFYDYPLFALTTEVHFACHANKAN